jgi:hypothetical protein
MGRYMKVFKGHVGNMARPKGDMVTRYAIEETLRFYIEYIQKVKSTRTSVWDDKEDPTMNDEIMEGSGQPCRLSVDLKA